MLAQAIPQCAYDPAHRALLFLNIRSYSGGARPWKSKAGLPSPSDGLVEVIAMDNVDVALLQLGGTGEAVCQAKKVATLGSPSFLISNLFRHRWRSRRRARCPCRWTASPS